VAERKNLQQRQQRDRLRWQCYPVRRTAGEAYARELAVRYDFADGAAVITKCTQEHRCDDGRYVELLALRSHNEGVRRRAREWIDGKEKRWSPPIHEQPPAPSNGVREHEERAVLGLLVSILISAVVYIPTHR